MQNRLPQHTQFKDSGETVHGKANTSLSSVGDSKLYFAVQPNPRDNTVVAFKCANVVAGAGSGGLSSQT
jgi:hypothetical protein